MTRKIAKQVLSMLVIFLFVSVVLPLVLNAKDEPVVVFYNDELISYCYTYQNPDLFDVDFKNKKSGKSSLKIGWDVPAGKWPGAGLGMAKTVDFTKYRENGVLSLWIKSDNGGEKIDIGFLDNAGYITTRPLDAYIGPLTRDWQKVEIPLKDFSNKATHWDDALGKNISGDFQWDAVLELTLIFGKADGDEHWINIDEVVIKMSE